MRAFGIAFATGVVFLLCLQVPPTAIEIALATIAGRNVSRCKRVFKPVIAGFLFGGFWVWLTIVTAAGHRLDEAWLGEDLRMTVRIISVPDNSAARTVFYAVRTDDPVTLLQKQQTRQINLKPEHFRLAQYGYGPAFHAGELWQLTVRLKPPSGLRNSGVFDRARWLLSKGVDATGYVRSKPAPQRLADSTEFSLAALREQLARQLAALPAATETVAFVQTLALGINHRVDQQSWQVLRDSGTAHLLAISGLHISLVAGFGLFAGRRIMATLLSRWPAGWQGIACSRKTAGLLVAFILAIAYALLAGFALPTQRALIVLSVWIVAALRFRILPPATGLSVALLLVLLFDPFAPLAPGFWLSFGTVAILFWLHGGHRSKNIGIVQTVRTHLLLGVILLPVTAWFFQSGSLVAPLANLVAIPLVTLVIVPLALATLLLSVVSTSLASIVLGITQWLIEQLLAGLQWLLSMLDGAVVLTLPSLAALLACLLGLWLLNLPRGLQVRLLCLPLLLPAVLYNIREPRIEGFELHVLDVGQGLAVLVLTADETLLYDTGGTIGPSLSMVEAVVMPYLQMIGRRRIDTLVVSHPDKDHAAGIEDVLRRFPDADVFASTLADSMPNTTRRCQAGDSRVYNGVWFSYLSPAAGDSGSENDLSCVLLVHHGNSRVLLTGDIEKPAEARLASRLQTQNEPPMRIDVMLAPHHGSSSSSSGELLDSFQIEQVVFPAGKRNRWGFPHEQVQMRYTLRGVRMHQTGAQGSLRFEFDASGLRRPPTSWWQTQRRYWHGLTEPACSSSKDPLLHMGLYRYSVSQPGQTLCGK
ncbi:MAG: DNA internalization-related competence protein ComEC/Rec2 [Granulosicoccus sp.]